MFFSRTKTSYKKTICIIWSLLLGASHCISLAEEEPQSALYRYQFVNGDKIEALPISGNWEKIVTQSPLFSAHTEIKCDTLLSLEQVTSPTELSKKSRAHIIFNNGDSLIGNLKEVQDEYLILNTDFAGELKIPRIFVDLMKIHRHQPTIFSGPGDVSEWQVSPKNSWQLDRNTWSNSGTGYLSRDIKTPEQFTLNLDLEWSNSLSLQLRIGTNDSGSVNPRTGYQFQFQSSRGQLELTRLSPKHGRVQVPTRQFNRILLRNMRNQKEAQFTLQVDRSKGLFIAKVNDQFLAEWKDDEKITQEIFGEGLQIYNQEFNKVYINSLSINEWNGVVDTNQNAANTLPDLSLTEQDTKKGYQVLELSNGDNVIGKITDIKEDFIKVETDYVPLKIAIERLTTLPLGIRNDEAKRRHGDVRGILAGGDKQLVFRLDKIEGNTAKIFSDHFGEATIDLRAFSRIEFWPHNLRMNRAREAQLNK